MRGRGWMQRSTRRHCSSKRGWAAGCGAAHSKESCRSVDWTIACARARAFVPSRLRCAALRPPHPSRHLRPPLSHVAMPAAGVVAASLRRATPSLPPRLPHRGLLRLHVGHGPGERGVPVVRLVPATPRRIKGCPALRPTNSARVCPMDPCFLPFLSSPSPPGPAPTTVRA